MDSSKSWSNRWSEKLVGSGVQLWGVLMSQPGGPSDKRSQPNKSGVCQILYVGISILKSVFSHFNQEAWNQLDWSRRTCRLFERVVDSGPLVFYVSWIGQELIQHAWCILQWIAKLDLLYRVVMSCQPSEVWGTWGKPRIFRAFGKIENSRNWG